MLFLIIFFIVSYFVKNLELLFFFEKIKMCEGSSFSDKSNLVVGWLFEYLEGFFLELMCLIGVVVY